MRGRSFPWALFAVAFATAISHRGLHRAQMAISDGFSLKCAHNAELRARRQKSESIATLAEVFGITQQRIGWILDDRWSRDAC